MRKIYSIKTHLMNGTVTMLSIVDNFTDRKIAEEAREAIIRKNKEDGNDVWVEEPEETTLYENRIEIPILNENKE